MDVSTTARFPRLSRLAEKPTRCEGNSVINALLNCTHLACVGNCVKHLCNLCVCELTIADNARVFVGANHVKYRHQDVAILHAKL